MITYLFSRIAFATKFPRYVGLAPVSRYSGSWPPAGSWSWQLTGSRLVRMAAMASVWPAFLVASSTKRETVLKIFDNVEYYCRLRSNNIFKILNIHYLFPSRMARIMNSLLILSVSPPPLRFKTSTNLVSKSSLPRVILLLLTVTLMDLLFHATSK